MNYQLIYAYVNFHGSLYTRLVAIDRIPFTRSDPRKPATNMSFVVMAECVFDVR